MNRQILTRTTLSWTAAGTLVLLPCALMAQTSNSSSGVAPQTTLAVKLISQNHGQTGTATFTQEKSGVKVAVLLDQSPPSGTVAVLKKGTCSISPSGNSGAADQSGNNSSSMTNSAGANGNSSTSSGASSGGNGSMAASFTIGTLKPTQGTNGTPAGAAQTTLRNVSLSQLVQSGYAVDVMPSGSNSGQPMLCSSLENALPPTTPAGSQ